MPDTNEDKNSDQALTEAMKRQVSQLSDEVHQLQLQNEALQKLVKALQVESMTDDLTGVHNRRYFDRKIHRLLATVDASTHPFCLLLADVDQLKIVNDQKGHSVGDKVLQEIASQLTELLRPQDSLSRIGGDEFAMVMPNTNLESCEKQVKEFRDGLDLEKFAKQDIAITLSFGCSVAKAGDSSTTFFDRADKSLYRSKKSRTKKDQPS